ncbi:DUF7537 family lipoprotein [Halorarius litoreus]|uniref:DUF7537 family lipoprotein n=1 Tax=Halorarius litoreus TaxID=2962676 RepID=UPI0020CE9E14|nr:hypothetical protein [Halorarius litoreus]
MRTQTLATLAVAAMLVLAGCSFAGGGQSTPTDGSGAVTDTPADDGSGPSGTESPAGQSFSYPAGYDEGGVVNATEAAASHRAALLATGGFTVDYDADVTTPNTTTYVRYDQRVETGSEEVVRQTNVTSGDLQGLVVRYYADDTVYVKSQQPGSENTTYANSSQSYSLASFTGVEFVVPALSDVSFASSERTTRDGTPVVVYSDATLDRAGSVFGNGVQANNVSDFSATLVVGEDGIVRELTYSATVTTGGVDRQVDVTVRVSGVDETTVDQPDWLDQA